MDEYWGRLAAESKCSEPKWSWAMAGPNHWIVEGDYETLLMHAGSPDGRKLSMKGPAWPRASRKSSASPAARRC